MKRNEITIRPAHSSDIYAMQTLRNMGWQDNYVNPETGVTHELLEEQIVPLPPTQANLDYNRAILNNPNNAPNNLVAEIAGLIVGVVFYELQANGEGETGVFVDRHYRGERVGTMLLDELVNRTKNTLFVNIFADNPSRGLYTKFGFVEEGEEFNVNLASQAYLPAQRLVLKREQA
jgi:ribosomal protein S18 acetylase RimI-like enzyme